MATQTVTLLVFYNETQAQRGVQAEGRALMIAALMCGCPINKPIAWHTDDEPYTKLAGWAMWAGEHDYRMEHNGVGMFEIDAPAPGRHDAGYPPACLKMLMPGGRRAIIDVDDDAVSMVDVVGE